MSAEMDVQFADLRTFVLATYSNLAVEKKVLNLKQFLPRGSTKVRNYYRAAIAAAKESGSPYVIIDKLDKLQTSIKEYHENHLDLSPDVGDATCGGAELVHAIPAMPAVGDTSSYFRPGNAPFLVHTACVRWP